MITMHMKSLLKNLFVENVKNLQLFLDDMRKKWKSI